MSLSRFTPEISVTSCSSLSSGFPLFPVQLTLMWNGATGHFLTVSSSFIWGYGHFKYTKLVTKVYLGSPEPWNCLCCLYSSIHHILYLWHSFLMGHTIVFVATVCTRDTHTQ